MAYMAPPSRQAVPPPRIAERQGSAEGRYARGTDEEGSAGDQPGFGAWRSTIDPAPAMPAGNEVHAMSKALRRRRAVTEVNGHGSTHGRPAENRAQEHATTLEGCRGSNGVPAGPPREVQYFYRELLPSAPMLRISSQGGWAEESDHVPKLEHGRFSNFLQRKGVSEFQET